MATPEDRKELDWDLSILVPEKGVSRKIRVTSNESVSAVMIKIASKLGDADWSDYAFWWPEKQIWLNKPRQTLYAYGIQSNAQLEFTNVHRVIIVEFPNKNRYRVRVNFSLMTFYVVAEICQELNIRHPEELSLMKSAFDKEGYVKFTGYHRAKVKRQDVGSREGTPGTDSIDSGSPPGSPSSHRRKYPQLALSPQHRSEVTHGAASSAVSVVRMADAPEGAFFSEKLQRSVTEKAFINGLWLDSSRTLYEQEVKHGDLLYLRYKYYTFKDIDPKLDEKRIDHLYEQAKWSILVEEVDCTEEEAYTFAALQFQVKLASTSPAYKGPVAAVTDQPFTNIDDALDRLQTELGQTRDPAAAESKALQLTGYCKFTKPTRLTFKGAKRYFFLLKGTNLSYYKHEDSYTAGEQPIQRFNLTGSEAIQDLDVSRRKFAFNVVLPSSDETGEIRLVFDTSDEYCSWMAGCRMAMKGRPLAKQGYEQELSSIKAIVAMQNKADTSAGASANHDELRPEDCVSSRILKKNKAKVVARQILEAHSSMLNMSLTDAKMQYIRNWQALGDFGITYFVIRVGRSRKDELLGVAYNRLILIDPTSMEYKKTWRYSAMRSWNVNWESKSMTIDHETERITFTCSSADLKVVHEFIGGNIWLSLRKEDEPLDITMLVKLTGGVTSNLDGWGSETMAKFITR